MYKITFKLTIFLFLAVGLGDVLGQQVSAIDEGTKYTLQNVGTGDYIASDDTSTYQVVPMADFTNQQNNIGLNFIFDHYNDGTLSFPDDYNIGNDYRGIMRGAGSGAVVHTSFQFDDPNPNGGQKQDKRWVATSTQQGPITTFRFEIASGGEERYLYQGTDGTIYNISVADMNDDSIAYTDGEDRSYWALAESSIVLSTEDVASNSVFVSNPVNDRIKISGLSGEVQAITVYSLQGAKVIEQTLSAATSEISLDASALSTGMYILNFESENGAFTKKILKK